MRQVPDDEHEAWLRAMRARARRDVEDMVPRPGHPVYGIAAPALTPAALTDQTVVNGGSTSITLAYGAWDSLDGPYVLAITSVTDAFAVPAAGSTTIAGEQGEASLRFAVEEELDRPAAWSDKPEPEPESESGTPFPVTTETLPIGEARVCRSGIVWAARLQPADADGAVVVTIIGRGLAPASVRLEPVTDLRPMVEAQHAITAARIERARQRPRPPLPELEPAEGAAALRALAEHELAQQREIQAAHRQARRRRRELGSGLLRSLLWRRAVGEHQRLRGSDQRAADDAVTVAVNHLGFLLENAPWFEADPRLRAAAIGETARHAMGPEPVPSDAAQRAWERYWSARPGWLPADGRPVDLPARLVERETLSDDCLRAWTAWTRSA